MSVNNLTGQNIQDTYQRVIHTDGTNIHNGTGSQLPISFNGKLSPLSDIFIIISSLPSL